MGECVRCIKCKECCGACDCTGGPQLEQECTCYELTGGHQPGCYFNRPPPKVQELSPEERRVLGLAVEVLRQSNFGLMLEPMKVDCIAIHCHPGDEADIRALYDAPIVVDPNQRRGTIGVVPYARAVNITMSIGFAEPDPPK